MADSNKPSPKNPKVEISGMAAPEIGAKGNGRADTRIDPDVILRDVWLAR